MSDIEELYHGHNNVLIFTNLDDIGEPYSCNQWGDRGAQFGGHPIITDDGVGSDLWGKFNTGSAFPSTAYIDHTMTVYHKANNPSLSTAQNIINQMLDKLYNSLLISANFEINFNGDIDGDGLINPGDSFDVLINVMNKSYSEDNAAINVNLDLSSDCDGIGITSTNLGQIGNISAGDTYQVEATISIYDSVVIDDYFLNLVITTDNIDDENNIVVEQFETDFSITLNQAGFPADMSGELISSAAIIDLDSDGVDEIFSSDKGGFVHVFEMDGTEWIDGTFPYETGDQNWGSPAIGNLNSDEFDDIVISSKNGQIYIFGSSQTIDSGLLSAFNSGGFITATPALGDVDGDGEDEIVFGQYGGPKRMYAINFDGSSVDGFPVELDEKVQRGVALADFNGNGKDDIVVGTDDEYIHLIHDDGTIAWSYETGGDIRVAPSVLELNTGEKIILAGSKDDNFYALNSDGTLRFMIETDDDISSEASIVDVEGVGPVIFFASGNMVYAVETDGDFYLDWPMATPGEVTSSIVFSEIDGMICVMFADEYGNVYIYDMANNLYTNFPISYSFPFKGSPTIIDTDNDGDLEMIVGSTQTLTNIDIKESGLIEGLWSTHRSSMNRDGYFLSSIESLDISDNISDRTFSIINVYPNPFNPSVSIDYFIASSNFVEINVMNIQGKIIENLESSFKTKGEHSITWIPQNISSGVYLLNVSTPNESVNHKLMFIK